MDRQTLGDRVHRFDKEGPDGLTSREGAGRPWLLDDRQMREPAQIVETGPEERWCGALAAHRSGSDHR